MKGNKDQESLSKSGRSDQFKKPVKPGESGESNKSKKGGQWKTVSDLHTHTVYSRHGHGKGTIEENVIAARNKGLKTIGISDHGPDHIMYGIRKSEYFKVRQQIERLKKKYTDIKILLGIEANIINRSGKLSISKEEEDVFDYIMAGYHFGTMGESPRHSLYIHMMNGIAGGSRDSKIKAANTELVISALEENKIAVLTHPGCKGSIFVKEVAQVCARRGTLMEINNSHGHLNTDQIREAAKTDVKFIINSDAHKPQNIGDFKNGLAAAMAAGIDLERIVNLETVKQ